MTPIEASELLGTLSVFDSKIVVTEDAARAWAAALDDVSAADAQEAAREHLRECRYSATPADILGRVRAIRAARWARYERYDHGHIPAPPTDPSDVSAGIRFEREFRRAIGDGLGADAADARACAAVGVPSRREVQTARPAYIRAALATARRAS